MSRPAAMIPLGMGMGLGLALALTACHRPPDRGPAAIVQARADATTVLAVGQTLEITLEGNAGTGYQWQLVESGRPQLVAVALADDGVGSIPDLPGGPTLQHLRFHAEQPGQTRLRLEYRRSWEAGQATAGSAEFRIQVR